MMMMLEEILRACSGSHGTTVTLVETVPDQWEAQRPAVFLRP